MIETFVELVDHDAEGRSHIVTVGFYKALWESTGPGSGNFGNQRVELGGEEVQVGSAFYPTLFGQGLFRNTGLPQQVFHRSETAQGGYIVQSPIAIGQARFQAGRINREIVAEELHLDIGCRTHISRFDFLESNHRLFPGVAGTLQRGDIAFAAQVLN